MKNTPDQKTNESATDTVNYAPGILPTRKNTVTADVLACLLESRVMTSIESVFAQSTTRLAAVIEYIERRYGWSVPRRDKIVGTNDGRVSTVREYFLPQQTITRAFEVNADDWINGVKAERAERRKESDKCKELAKKLNISRSPASPRGE